MASARVHEDWRDFAVFKLNLLAQQIERCLALLDDEQLWQRANPACNSVGNLVLHLTGNLRQWVVGPLSGQAVARDRPAEFAASSGDATEIAKKLRETVAQAADAIEAVSDEALSAQRAIQGYDVRLSVAIFHAVEHFSFHAGQIVHITKALTGRDLSLYDAAGRPRDPEHRSP
jgi:uncharacterized damage-inducible protein DinB